MSKQYSKDLKEKALEYIALGNSKEEASRIFGPSTRTLYEWEKKREKGLSLEITTKRKPLVNSRIKDLKQFEFFVEKNPHLTQRAMAKKWSTEMKISISKSSISRTLNKIDFTHKKNTPSYKEACPKKREIFLQEFNKIDFDDLYFLDESALEDDEYVRYGWSKRGKRVIIKKKPFQAKKRL